MKAPNFVPRRPAPHGTRRRYGQKCRCGLCRAANAAWQRVYRAGVSTPCSIEGCSKPVACRGWCGMHVMRWRRNGDPLSRNMHVDFRALPHGDGEFDTVCFDPPYVPAGGQGTTTAPNYRVRFGLAEYRSQAELDNLVCGGLAECARVARFFVLVKCNDYVNARVFTLGHRKLLDAADEIGLACHDLIVHHTGSGPGGHNIYTVLRARRAHSYLLVFTPASSRRVVDVPMDSFGEGVA